MVRFIWFIQFIPHHSFVHALYIIKITQLFRRLGITLIVIFTHAARESTHNESCGLCQK
jgi:hypothetical protein